VPVYVPAGNCGNVPPLKLMLNAIASVRLLFSLALVMATFASRNPALAAPNATVVVNAVEALNGEGRLKLHVLDSRDWRDSKRRGVRIFIADNGTGISLENRQRIFEPFFTTKGENGTGLGLWVTSGLVHKHGGWVRVRSSTQPGRSGTCFAVFFPDQKVSTMPDAAGGLDKSA